MWAYRGVTVKLNVFDFTVRICFTKTITARFWEIAGTGFARLRRSLVERLSAPRAMLMRVASSTNRRTDWFKELYDLESEAQERGLSGESLLASRRAFCETGVGVDACGAYFD